MSIILSQTIIILTALVSCDNIKFVDIFCKPYASQHAHPHGKLGILGRGSYNPENGLYFCLLRNENAKDMIRLYLRSLGKQPFA